jgi:hypothetical protein
MELDLAVIMISGVFCIYMLIKSYLNKQQWQNYRQSYRYLWIGLMILVTVTIFNSLTEMRWDLHYVLSFLGLKKVGKWLFRVIASYGYISLAMGLEVLVIVKLENTKIKSK